MPRHLPATLTVFIMAIFALAACEDRRSGDASVDQPTTERTGSIQETAPADRVETDADPTPQTGRGGAIPEAGERPSR